MKVTLFIVIILNVISLTNKLQSQNFEIKQKCEIHVVKIDSTMDYIIVYGISNNNKYKIVTRKVDSDCNNIFVSGKYNVTLISMNENDSFKIMNRCDIHYGWGGDNIILNEPDWGCNIYLVEEIFGLCYTTDVEKIEQFEKWIEKHPLTFPRTKKNDTFRLESQKLLSKEFKIKLPVPYHTQKDNFDQSVIYYYSFVDSAYIIVVQGSLVEFPIDNYNPQKTEIKKRRKISVGFENDKFWRKDIFEDVRIYYDNVSEKNKKIYDKILDEIIIRPL